MIIVKFSLSNSKNYVKNHWKHVDLSNSVKFDPVGPIFEVIIISALLTYQTVWSWSKVESSCDSDPELLISLPH